MARPAILSAISAVWERLSPRRRSFSIQSLESFKKIAQDRKVDVLIANHQTQDQAIPKLEELRLRRSGDPNPYVIGNERYIRYLSIQQECTRFAMVQQGQSRDGAQRGP